MSALADMFQATMNPWCAGVDVQWLEACRWSEGAHVDDNGLLLRMRTVTLSPIVSVPPDFTSKRPGKTCYVCRCRGADQITRFGLSGRRFLS